MPPRADFACVKTISRTIPELQEAQQTQLQRYRILYI